LQGKARSVRTFVNQLLRSAAALALAACLCPAQHYTFSTLAADMDNLNVDCIAQDRAGYLWVGTEAGLYRYDGTRFKKFGAAEGLEGRTIQSVYTGSDGTLLVGTTAGIYFERQDGAFAEIYAPEGANRFSQQLGTVFTADGSGQVIAADRGGAFLLRHTGPDQWKAEALRLEEGPIWSVLRTPGGALWYGCDNDLCRLENGKTTHMGAVLHLPEAAWLHLLLAPDGHLWIRGGSHLGEISIAENRYAAHDLPGQSNAEPYDSLVMDTQGRIAASQGPAFALWEKDHWRMVTERNGLTRFDISALFADREGSLWIGAVGHGLKRWVGQDRWEALTIAEGLSDDVQWATLRDKRGRLWVGTESGLDWLAPGANTAVVWKSAGIETSRGDSLAESPDGTIWLGTAAGSLVRIDGRTLVGREWKTPEVYKMLLDGGHRLWLATAGGLYVVDLNARSLTPQRVEEAGIKHPQGRFRDLSLDPAGRMWAVADEGLFRLEAEGWQRIDLGQSGVLPEMIATDRQGNLWASGNFAGVMRMRIAGGRVGESEHITRPRLLSDQVVSLYVDRRGWLWAGEDAGLTVFDGHSWRSFDQDDGLIWNDQDSNGINEDADGSMWIGTSGGLSHLMKPETGPVIAPQPPAIPQIAFGGTPISDGTSVRWSASPLSVEMATLEFRDAHHIQIRYRLLGLEQDWVDAAEGNARYARLDPGNYKFQAEAVDVSSGAESATKEIDFAITPRWWQSDLLRVALVLLGCVGIVALWRWRVHLLIVQKHQLELAVERRTDDLQREKAELLRTREQMRHFAEHDDLTGLWNHRIIIERLRGEVDRSQREGVPISLILVDLDHFKEVNDTYGHPAGDHALREISAVFLRSVRSYDWVGRYGGEEFLLILPGTNVSSARLRAEHLRVAVQVTHIQSADTNIKITASFGVASGFAADHETLLHEADAALYRAKNNGRNCVVATELKPPPHLAAAWREIQ
jgi:diguanylate cyclase (GGDEF)-like protein